MNPNKTAAAALILLSIFFSINSPVLAKSEAKNSPQIQNKTVSKTPVKTLTSDDVSAYVNAITANGGTISASNVTAITAFIDAAKAQGYWDKLLDVGPFAGDQLNAALVKLKNAPGTSQVLINHNFVATDYSPSNGLQGANSGKWLDTGLNFNYFTSGAFGMAFWVGDTGATTTGNSTLMGTSNSASGPAVQLTQMPQFECVFANGNLCTTTRTASEGLKHAMRSSLSSASLYYNGILAVTNNTTVTLSGKNLTFALFAARTATGANGTNEHFFDGKGYFYAIDDGSMTSAQATQYYQDVKALMAALGRAGSAKSVAPMKMALIVGQSLAIGSNGNPSLSIVQPYNNKSFSTGSLWGGSNLHESAFGPLIEKNGSNVETISSSFANSVSAFARSLSTGDASQDLIIKNFGVGGWGYIYLKYGTNPFIQSINSVTHALALTGNYTSGGLVVPGIISVHGESDGNSDTYQTDIRQWQSDYESEIKKITGQTGTIPMFHTQPSAWTSVSGPATSKSPYEILAESEKNPNKTILVGPKYILPYGTGAQGIHLTNIGYRTLGQYYAKAWNKVVVQGQTWNPLRPDSIYFDGLNIDLTYVGNDGNIVLDTNLVSNPGNYGFEYYDDTNSTSISSVAVIGSNKIRVTLNHAPTGNNKRIRYAFTGIPGNDGGPMSGPRGNVRDSSPVLSMYDDNGDGQLNDHLYDWSVHFDKKIPLAVINSSAVATSTGVGSLVVATSTSAESISVNLNMVASSTQVLFGLTPSYGLSTSVVMNSDSPSFNLTGLIPCTAYHYMASSTGVATNKLPVYDPAYAGSSVMVSDKATSSDKTFISGGCPLPVINLSAVGPIGADNTNIFQVSWTATNADDCHIVITESEKGGSWSGYSGTSGISNSITGKVSEPTTFTVVCSGIGGNASKSVVAEPSYIPVSLDFDSYLAAPDSNNYGIGWSSSGVSNCELADSGIYSDKDVLGTYLGPVKTEGGMVVNLTGKNDLTLTCTTDGESISKSISVGPDTTDNQ